MEETLDEAEEMEAEEETIEEGKAEGEVEREEIERRNRGGKDLHDTSAKSLDLSS